jgi:hypothetical protein
MIDFCLGNRDTAESALGQDVASRYLQIRLDIQLNGKSFALTRSLDKSYGPLTKIKINGADEVSVDAFSTWILAQLGWPEFNIPKGRNPRHAIESVPLTFRTLWRHIYRREGSWLEFAQREEEFHRRAVTRFFLGLGGEERALAELRTSQAVERLTSLESESRALEELASEVLMSVTQELGLDSSERAGADHLVRDLEHQAQQLQRRRELVLAEATETTENASALTENYRAVDASLQDSVTRLTEIEKLSVAYADALEGTRGEAERLARAEVSVHELSSIPVRICPNCMQSVRPDTSAEICYLCHQEMSDHPAIERRLKLEVLALRRETQETEELVLETSEEVERLRSKVAMLEAERQDLRRRMDNERREMVAPFVGELQTLSHRLGQIEAQKSALMGLSTIVQKRESLARNIVAARQHLQAAEAEVDTRQRRRDIAAQRCSAFADRMNEFLRALGNDWRLGEITLTEEDVEFYAGTGRWERLGAEAKVLFMYAYHYALLCLPETIPEGARSPGIAVLDNPIQHGLADSTTQKALSLLVEAAIRNGAQVVATLAHPAAVPEGADVIVMTDEYGIV